MRIEVELKGDAELAKMLERVVKRFPRERQMFLKQEAEKLKARVKKKTPADTGHLRRSWASGEVEGDTIEVGNNVEYAGFVEFPTRQVVFGKDTGRIRPRIRLRAGHRYAALNANLNILARFVNRKKWLIKIRPVS